MKIRDLLSPFILIGAGLAFVIVSFLVILTNGKNRRLIASKMKIGALLLTFTWFASGCSPLDPSPTCYAPALATNVVEIKSKNPEIDNNLNFMPGDTVYGIIANSTLYAYSYQLTDSISNQIKQSGALTNDSIIFKEKYFHFILDSKLDKGTYSINIIGTDSLGTKQIPISGNDKIYIK
jgi:hypothetical protein